MSSPTQIRNKKRVDHTAVLMREIRKGKVIVLDDGSENDGQQMAFRARENSDSRPWHLASDTSIAPVRYTSQQCRAEKRKS